jgi:hypothetical protein
MKGQGTGEARKALADARGRLFQAAARALRDGTLTDEQAVRVRLALKRARSSRNSRATIAAAAKSCVHLEHELQRQG